jgi:hypothetical protein
VNQPVQIIFVAVPAAASNKRVYRREPAQPIPHRNGQHWPLNHPIPDAETRRHLDTARREIANSRPEITRHLNAARRELVRCQPEIERFLGGGPGL